MKQLLLLVVSLVLVACSEDNVYLNDHNGRITDLERRADLNDQLNSLQDYRLDLLEAALDAETQARIDGDADLSAALQQEISDRAAGDADLQAMIQAEQAARIAGDLANANALSVEISNRIAGDNQNSAALAVAMFIQSITNFGLQQQINTINGKLTVINNKINNLQSQINNLDVRVDVLEAEMDSIQMAVADLEASLQAQIDDLQAQQLATQAQLDQEGVKLFKCNASNSTERIMKINGKFYAVMNRVTTKNVQVITGSSSQTVVVPKLCKNPGDEIKLPQSNGNCKNNETVVSGTGTSTTVPSYTTANTTVVDSVKIALDVLNDGSYQTTDGGPACVFGISNNGTTSTNLVPVQ